MEDLSLTSPQKNNCKKIFAKISVHQHPATSTAMFKIKILVLQEKIMFKASLCLTQGNNLQTVGNQVGASQWEGLRDNVY